MIHTSPSPTLRTPQKWSKEFNEFLEMCLDLDVGYVDKNEQLIIIGK